MEWIVNNWYVLVALFCILGAIVGFFMWFFSLPTDKKKENVKQFLKKLVTEAEKELGTKTGELKLATVYAEAIKVFPWIASVVSFDTFKVWVDEALEWMNHQLETNPAFAKYVKGE